MLVDVRALVEVVAGAVARARGRRILRSGVIWGTVLPKLSVRATRWIDVESRSREPVVSGRRNLCTLPTKTVLSTVRARYVYQNHVCHLVLVDQFYQVETELEPIALLDQLQSIENDMGRKKVIDKGPRNIDLDILLYGDETVDHERLKVPHIGILEREFVLRPLAEYVLR